MKYNCTKCKAKYYHNFFIPKGPDFKCRFCGAKMEKSKEPMTTKEFAEFYLKEKK